MRPAPSPGTPTYRRGTVNGQGSLRVSIARTGESTALAGIMRLVSQAQTSRSRAQALADGRRGFLR
jgi:Cu2+-exporting ATPase